MKVEGPRGDVVLDSGCRSAVVPAEPARASGSTSASRPSTFMLRQVYSGQDRLIADAASA